MHVSVQHPHIELLMNDFSLFCHFRSFFSPTPSIQIILANSRPMKHPSTIPRPVSNISRNRRLTSGLGVSFHFQKVLVDGRFFLSLSQSLSLWAHHLVLAVLFRTIGNLSPTYVQMLQIFEQSWYTLSETSPPGKLESFMRLETLIGTRLPHITLSHGRWVQRNQKTHSVSWNHMTSFMSFVTEVNPHVYSTRTAGGGRLMGPGSRYQVHPSVLWLAEHFLHQKDWR